MKIAGYVGDLLYDYECVVIPGLGGFITNDKSARVVAVTHHFRPPFREVHFNVHLKANDGLLVNYVARQEELSYKEAKSRVDQFSFQCLKALDQGKRIRFHGIGTLSRDEKQHLVFSQDKSVNYNPQAFGLGNFMSPAITRTSDEERMLGAIKKVVTEKKSDPTTPPKPIRKRKKMVASKKRSPFKNQLIFLMVVFFLMGVGYVYMHRYSMEYYFQRHLTKIPFLYNSPQAYMANNTSMFQIGKASYYAPMWFPGLFNKEENSSVTNDKIPEVSEATLLPIQSPNTIHINKATSTAANTLGQKEDATINTELSTKNNTPASTAVLSENIITSNPKNTPPIKNTYQKATFSFYIIAGSFKNEENASNLVAQLNNIGFDALIADTNKYGMFRVAYQGFYSAEEAATALSKIKSQHNQKAWILKK